MTTRTQHNAFAPSALALRATAPLSLTRLFALARQRRALADLDDATLEDIGVSREQANTEARRPLWDVPETWLR